MSLFLNPKSKDCIHKNGHQLFLQKILKVYAKDLIKYLDKSVLLKIDLFSQGQGTIKKFTNA